jgi:hypothetical protein
MPTLITLGVYGLGEVLKMIIEMNKPTPEVLHVPQWIYEDPC